MPPLESARVESLLAYLVLPRDAAQPRQRLAFLLWPGSTERQARTNLRHVLPNLRRALPGADEYLEVTARTLRWRPEAPVWIDVSAFEEALNRNALADAVDLYAGELMQGCVRRMADRRARAPPRPLRRRAGSARVMPELPGTPLSLPPEEQRQRLLDAISRALLAAAAPVLLIADDLQWPTTGRCSSCTTCSAARGTRAYWSSRRCAVTTWRSSKSWLRRCGRSTDWSDRTRALSRRETAVPTPTQFSSARHPGGRCRVLTQPPKSAHGNEPPTPPRTPVPGHAPDRESAPDRGPWRPQQPIPG
jgi:hypothetical protein